MLSNAQVIESVESGLCAVGGEAAIQDSKLIVRVLAHDGSAWRTGFYLRNVRDERRLTEIIEEIADQIAHKNLSGMPM